MFGFLGLKQKPEMPHEWAGHAPWLSIGTRTYDPSTGLFLSVSQETGDSNYLALWESAPLLGASDGTLDKLKAALSGAFPPGTFIQIGTLAVPDVADRFALYIDGKTAAENPVLRELADRKYRLLAESGRTPLISSSGVLTMVKRIIVTLKIPVANVRADAEREAVMEAVERVGSALKTVGLQMRRLDAESYLVLMRYMHHVFSAAESWYDSDRVLSEQIFYPGDEISVERDRMVFRSNVAEEAGKEYYAKALSVKYFPQRASLGTMNYAIGDPGGLIDQITHPYWMVLTMHYPDQIAKEADLQRKYAMISHQAFGSTTNIIPLLGYKKRGFDTLMHAKTAGGAGVVVETNFTIWLFHDNASKLAQLSSAITSYYTTLGFNIIEDGRILDQLWSVTLPGGATVNGIKHLHRFHTMLTQHAIQFLPLLGEWQGSGPSGTMAFVSRRGEPVLFDLYESTSQNAAVFAETGAGKSFFTQALIADYLAEGAKVWTIDVGYSYKKLSACVGGSFIQFNNESNLCLNPFSKVKDIDDSVEIIKAMLAKMAAPEEGLDSFRMAVLEEAVKSVWMSHSTSGNVTLVANWCLDQNDERIRDIGKQLYPFTSYGSYGRWFNGENNLDLDNDFVVLELEELKSMPTLQKVVLIQLMDRISEEMYSSGQKRRKILVIDEAWGMLDDPVMAKAIEAAYRKVRKYNGSIIVVTQSIADLYSSPNGRAIYQNAAWQFILQQKSESIDAALDSKQFSMDAYGTRMLKLVHTAPGKYSELMIRRSGDEWGVVRLALDRFTQVLFSTSGAERDVILAAVDRGEDVVEAINNFIENERSSN